MAFADAVMLDAKQAVCYDSKTQVADKTSDATHLGRSAKGHRTNVGQVRTAAQAAAISGQSGRLGRAWPVPLELC